MDLLNFNYRFKGINSEFASLKDYENIKIQTDTFKDMKDITELITQVTGINTKPKSKNTTNNAFELFYFPKNALIWNKNLIFAL